jgi:hypothetical protein
MHMVSAAGSRRQVARPLACCGSGLCVVLHNLCYRTQCLDKVCAVSKAQECLVGWLVTSMVRTKHASMFFQGHLFSYVLLAWIVSD